MPSGILEKNIVAPSFASIRKVTIPMVFPMFPGGRLETSPWLGLFLSLNLNLISTIKSQSCYSCHSS
jgi:hypothetical protein